MSAKPAAARALRLAGSKFADEEDVDAIVVMAIFLVAISAENAGRNLRQIDEVRGQRNGMRLH